MFARTSKHIQPRSENFRCDGQIKNRFAVLIGTRKYRKGQAMMHSTFGQGEVTAVIEPQKIDVLFGDRNQTFDSRAGLIFWKLLTKNTS